MSEDTKKIIYSMVGVSKHYNKQPIIKDISLSYFYGAKIGVLGLNGSGKIDPAADHGRGRQGVQRPDHPLPGVHRRLPRAGAAGRLQPRPCARWSRRACRRPSTCSRSSRRSTMPSPTPTPTWRSSASARRWCRTSSTRWTPGSSTRASTWPWTPCAARRGTPR
ncbi:MAG: hypothetical protein MZU95_13825 [Desulfomicrobium escambiense]|nr:hypothetical protein [Desulfomicrobium escambiense]